MSVNVPAAINRIYQEFSTSVLTGIDEAPHVMTEYSMEVPSSSRSTMHAWLANQAVVREWKGKRVANSMGARTWEVINRPFELTYEFEVNQILDDLEGLVASAIMYARDGGEKWARHEDLLCANTLEQGDTKECWDGQNFFDTDHPNDIEGITSGVYSNLITGAPLAHASFNNALVRLKSYKNEDGSPMVGPGNDLKLIVPAALELAAEQIVAIKNLTPAASYGLFGTGGMSENPLYGKAKVVVNQYLSSDTDWYLTARRGIVAPIMFQRRQGVETNEQGLNSPIYFEEKKIRIGSDARYEASYTFPQLAIKNRAA